MNDIKLNPRMRGRAYACTRWKYNNRNKTCFTYIGIEININNESNNTDNIDFWANLISAESLHFILMIKNMERASKGIDRLGLHTGTPEQMTRYNSGLVEHKIGISNVE